MNARYHRPHKYDQLGPAGRRLASVPRYGRLIAMLPAERFDLLTSEAATYWEVYSYIAVDPREETGLLDDGLRATEAQHFGWHEERERVNRRSLGIRRWQVRLARDLLAAIAFEMFLGDAGKGNSHPMFTVVGNLDGFLKRAFDRLEASGAYRDARNDPIEGKFLWDDWEHLKAMDSHGLKHQIFSATEERLQFTDITTQTFFAAYWACRWANDDDRKTMWKWLPDPLGDKKEMYREFWELVVEMPVDAVDAVRYEQLLVPLYDGTWTDEQGLPIRSTELIYRSWDRMKDTQAGQIFRSESRELLEGKGSPERVAVAKTFKGVREQDCPFLSLCEGERGAEDKGQFVMGARKGNDPEYADGEGPYLPPHQVRLTHYRLNCCCVTDSQYELFDRRHHPRRTYPEETRDETVVHVSWYDAWCFARWLGEIELDDQRYRVVLPSEAQWEYAFRAGREILLANQVDRTFWRDDGNPWGFVNMGRELAEWCFDRFDRSYSRIVGGKEIVDPLGSELASERVIRGAGWEGLGWGTSQLGDRSWHVPGYEERSLSFRLAAVPVESNSDQ